MTLAAADPSISADAPDVHQLGPGEPLLPGFLAHAKLGGGARCESWLCWSGHHSCFVTVKMARPNHAGRPMTRAAIAREATTLRALQHPAFPRFLGAAPDDAVPHLVSEFIEGPTLAAALQEDGPFDRDDVVSVGIQMAAALHYLHAVAGIVHLDVKPSNVVLRDGRPVLLDFGTARAIGAPAPAGPARGTPGYMSPEQRRRRPATPAMDVYALGVVLGELLHGEPAPKRRRAWAPSRPRRPLASTLALLAHDDPERRPRSARAVIGLLDRHIESDDDRPVPRYALIGGRRRS
jgi:serine/threonine protein kinase